MKKVLIIISSLLILCSCSSSKDSWENIETKYNNIKAEVEKISENTTTYLKNDYLNAIEEIDTIVDKLKKDSSEENVEQLVKLVKLSHQMNIISSAYNGDASSYILKLANVVDSLIKNIYEGKDDEFTSLKTEAEGLLDKLEGLSDEQWSKVEKKVLVSWNDEEFKQLESDTLNELTDKYDLTEYELEDLKDFIIDNYELIKYGVSDYDEDTAKQIYADAIKLEAYTKDCSSEEGLKVLNFARHIKAYVKSCYGKQLDETEVFDTTIDEEIESATKWTQSTWNIITTEIKA